MLKHTSSVGKYLSTGLYIDLSGIIEKMQCRSYDADHTKSQMVFLVQSVSLMLGSKFINTYSVRKVWGMPMRTMCIRICPKCSLESLSLAMLLFLRVLSCNATAPLQAFLIDQPYLCIGREEKGCLVVFKIHFNDWPMEHKASKRWHA